MSEMTQTQTLEQTLNKTDLGHIIFEYRKVFFGVIAAILLAVMGFSMWKQSQQTHAESISVKVFEFQTKTWSGAKEGKVSIPELVKVFNGLETEVKNAPIMVPLALEMGKFLAEKGSYAEAEEILSKVTSQHPVSLFFLSNQRAVVLEKLNKIPEAINVLENVAKNKDSIMMAKLNLELGRLNLLNGEKSKAQTHFDYIISTFPNDEYAKLAKLYLAKMAQ